MIVLFACDIAKLIGENKYESRTRSLFEFWKKFNYESYEEALLSLPQEPLVSLLHQAMSSDDVKADIEVAATQYLPEETDLAIKAVYSKVCQDIESHSGVSDKRKQVEMEKAFFAVKSEIHKKQGSFHQTAGLNRFENATNRKVSLRNGKLYTEYLRTDDGNICYKIVGRCDGIDLDNKAIIEHKHRVNRLFDKLPNYERIQLFIYMFLTDIKKAELVQHFEGVSYSLAVVEWDDDEWDKLKLKCDEFVDDYDIFLGDKSRQEALLYKFKTFDGEDELDSAIF